MKLSELEPGFITRYGSEERIGVHFLCPKCKEQQIYISTNDPEARVNWKVSGDLANLTLHPSVDARHVLGGYDDKPRVECNWHGWVQNGEVRDA